MTITNTTTITMTGRTAVSASDSVTVDAIDVVQYLCEHGDSAVEINLSAATTGKNKFLAIIADNYPDEAVPGTPDITYKWNGTGTTTVYLGEHHVYSAGMDALTAGVTKLYLYNAGSAAASDATITFIVGRTQA